MPEKHLAKILRCWPAMRKSASFLRSSDAKCLRGSDSRCGLACDCEMPARVGLPLRFGLRCELPRCQMVERCEPLSVELFGPLFLQSGFSVCPGSLFFFVFSVFRLGTSLAFYRGQKGLSLKNRRKESGKGFPGPLGPGGLSAPGLKKLEKESKKSQKPEKNLKNSHFRLFF